MDYNKTVCLFARKYKFLHLFESHFALSQKPNNRRRKPPIIKEHNFATEKLKNYLLANQLKKKNYETRTIIQILGLRVVRYLLDNRFDGPKQVHRNGYRD